MTSPIYIYDELEQVKSLGTPSGRSSHTCGYCSAPGTRTDESSSYQAAGLDAVRLTCEVYQKMIDRGWRRSGTWCYKPDLRISCCPQYTIKLDALAFNPTRRQRKIANRWNKFVLEGGESEAMVVDTDSKKSKSRGTQQRFHLVESVHASEASFHSNKHPSHNFEVILEPASFSEEKYDLYVKYQLDVHNDSASKPHRFERFLVTSPLPLEDIPYPSPPPAHLPKKYGSYHQLYRLDGKLMAMSVLDILPYCVSSVYFMYDKAWERFSLGKVSVLREASLAKEIHDAGMPDMKYVYMGFYIQSCQKMRYKGDYYPSYLLDPESYEWYPLEKCRPMLEQNRYACFSEPSHSIAGDPPQDMLHVKPPRIVDTDVLDNILILLQTRSPDGVQFLCPVYKTTLWNYNEIREEYDAFIEGLGTEIAQKVVSNV